ncbi:hypothetical protein [Actinomadura sp. DC4]|uniref:hypothetical protein n=1 Tax=Actinomadura sp. DC4 TaxID=3055069 RepID=UPI0025AEDDB8|nr:hypothetical protein [Actinomadura sp. DC4]MDN3357278.1 hypothetical protein [Actinomadura sp. DC4]
MSPENASHTGAEARRDGRTPWLGFPIVVPDDRVADGLGDEVQSGVDRGSADGPAGEATDFRGGLSAQSGRFREDAHQVGDDAREDLVGGAEDRSTEPGERDDHRGESDDLEDDVEDGLLLHLVHGCRKLVAVVVDGATDRVRGVSGLQQVAQDGAAVVGRAAGAGRVTGPPQDLHRRGGLA